MHTRGMKKANQSEGRKGTQMRQEKNPIETEMTAMTDDIIDFFIRFGTGEDKY